MDIVRESVVRRTSCDGCSCSDDVEAVVAVLRTIDDSHLPRERTSHTYMRHYVTSVIAVRTAFLASSSCAMDDRQVPK